MTHVGVCENVVVGPVRRLAVIRCCVGALALLAINADADV